LGVGRREKEGRGKGIRGGITPHLMERRAQGRGRKERWFVRNGRTGTGTAMEWRMEDTGGAEDSGWAAQSGRPL